MISVGHRIGSSTRRPSGDASLGTTTVGVVRNGVKQARAVGLVAMLVTVVLVSGCAGSKGSSSGPGTTGGSGTTAPAGTQPPRAVTVAPTNPYYLAAKALLGDQVLAGTTVGGCVIVAYTKCPGVDLAGKYLQGGFLGYADLTGANLSNTDLLQANVAYAKLDGINLTGSKMSATSTSHASFVGAHLSDLQCVLCAASNTNFSKADLRGANFTSTGLTSSNFRGADLSGANFTLADLTGADLTDAKLDHAIYCQTVMPDGTIRNPQPSPEAAVNTCGHPVAAGAAPITINYQSPYYALVLEYDTPYVETGSTVGGCKLVAHTDCSGANLAGKPLIGVIMPFARLERTDFSAGDLTDLTIDLATASGAHLRSVKLNGASLTGADLAGADLSGATLQFASLNGTNLTRARLVGTNLNFSSTIGTDFTGADLRGVKFADGNNSGAKFTNANLSGADLTNADLTGGDLTGADLDGAIFCNTLMPDATVRNPVDGACPGG